MFYEVKTKLKYVFLLFTFFCIASIVNAQQASDSLPKEEVFETFTDTFVKSQNLSCQDCSSYSTCSSPNGAEISAPAWLRYLIIFIAIVILGYFLAKKFNWQAVGLMLVLLLLGFIPKQHFCLAEHNLESNKVFLAASEPLEKSESKTDDEFAPLSENEEFEPIDDKDKFNTSNENDEFEAFDDSSEFAPITDENLNSAQETIARTESTIWQDRNFTLSLLILAATIIAGILVRYKATRKLRVFFLIASIVYLGFINGACPCMISSFQNVILFFAGIPIKAVTLLWFLGLIPVTYFFGKVWCGWVCHLGALQEFIYRPGILKVLQNQKAQKILKYVRISILIILILQILITKTNIFIHYDPFKVAFNLFSANKLGYISLAILLISSLLIYRPFCRTVCPVGLILGWVTLIPGSKKLVKKDSCIDCKSCSNSCKQNAMVYENKKSVLNSDDCILCGECIDSCKFSSLEIKQLNRK